MDLKVVPHLNQINNVGLGLVFSTDFSIGPTYRYHDMAITMTAAAGKALALADFLDVYNFNANGNTQRTALLKEHDAIVGKFGTNYQALVCNSTGSGSTLAPVMSGGVPQVPQAASQTTCFIRFYWEEPWRKGWTSAMYRKFYTQWRPKAGTTTPQVLSSFQFTGSIPNTANNAGATGVSVQIWNGTDTSVGLLDAAGNPVSNILRWERLPISYTAAGDQPITNLVKYDKGKTLCILEQVDIFSGSAGDDITHLVLSADGRVVRDVLPINNNKALITNGFSTLVWNVDQFTLVMDETDDVTAGLFLSTPNGKYVNTLNITATLGAAAGANKVLNCIAQTWGPIK